jgi:hypothetical protein
VSPVRFRLCPVSKSPAKPREIAKFYGVFCCPRAFQRNAVDPLHPPFPPAIHRRYLCASFAERVLPVDPLWKSQYAASARCLVRDGVNEPLANLFVHSARPFPPDPEGINGARNTSEAFLFRRLATLSETAGRSRLNAELPIPFDGWGKMEADLLCRQRRLVVKIDGGQHLADAEA